MASVLFSNGHLLRFDRKPYVIGKPYPPLATIAAAAFLRERGQTVWIAGRARLFPQTVVTKIGKNDVDDPTDHVIVRELLGGNLTCAEFPVSCCGCFWVPPWRSSRLPVVAAARPTTGRPRPTARPIRRPEPDFSVAVGEADSPRRPFGFGPSGRSLRRWCWSSSVNRSIPAWRSLIGIGSTRAPQSFEPDRLGTQRARIGFVSTSSVRGSSAWRGQFARQAVDTPLANGL
jgi:hypothetical protein